MANPSTTARIRLDAEREVREARADADARVAEMQISIDATIEARIRDANADRDRMRAIMNAYTQRVSDLADKAIAMDRANDQMLKVFIRARQKAQKSLWAIREGNTAAGADFCNWIHRAMQSERDRIQRQMKDYRPIERPAFDPDETYEIEEPVSTPTEPMNPETHEN